MARKHGAAECSNVLCFPPPLQGYSTLPGYGNGKEAVRPITIWKGNSYTTISARDPAFSGKDSGKGDSDFNDSDSDVSGDTGLKKDGVVVPPMGGQNGESKKIKPQYQVEFAA